MEKLILIEFNPQNEQDTSEAIQAAEAYKNNGFNKIILQPSSTLILDKCLGMLLVHKKIIFNAFKNYFVMQQ